MNAQDLFDTYFEDISIISSLFFSNSTFTLKLYGDSFNSSSPHLYRQSDCELSCSHPSCLALFVHEQSVIIQDETLSAIVSEDRALKFVCKNVVGSVFNGSSAVCLSPTSDTIASLQSDCCGLSGKVLVTDDNDTGQYFLSGNLLGDSFPRRILFCYSPVIELSESESSGVVYDHRAVETTAAIASESWPSAALSWVAQCHPWINCDVLNTVASTSVYFVPKSVSRCCAGTMSQKNLLWNPEFTAAEDLLIKSLGVELKIAYQLLLQLVAKHRLSCCCVSKEFLVKHALFWYLDEVSATGEWNEKSVVEYFVHALQKLHLFLQRRHFPHYFMPGVNILCSCDSSVGDILWMEEAGTRLTDIQLKADVIQQVSFSSCPDVSCNISRHLKDLFAYSISMSFIQLFQCLHSVGSVDQLIERHRDMLNHLHGSPVVSHHLFVKPLVAWINSSLGTMYLVKACTTSSDHYTHYTQKAEHFMLEAVNETGMPSCTLNLIYFLMKMERYREASSVMEMLLASAESCAIPSQNCVTDALAFHDQLLTVWHHASWRINVMFSHVEASVLIPRLQSSLSFARCDQLGYSDPPVAVLKHEFWMQYIGALCYTQCNDARALKMLVDAERSLDDCVLQGVSSSDRAYVAYYNILAGTLLLMTLPKLFIILSFLTRHFWSGKY